MSKSRNELFQIHSYILCIHQFMVTRGKATTVPTLIPTMTTTTATTTTLTMDSIESLSVL